MLRPLIYLSLYVIMFIIVAYLWMSGYNPKKLVLEPTPIVIPTITEYPDGVYSVDSLGNIEKR